MVSIHAPVKARHVTDDLTQVFFSVSIHAPVKARHELQERLGQVEQFQSTRL